MVNAILEFIDIFVRSDWAQPLDFVIALIIMAGCYVYVFLLKPKLNDQPNFYGDDPGSGFTISKQHKRFAISTLSITFGYALLRALGVMLNF